MGTGHRNTAQNNLQLAEGWTSPKADASWGSAKGCPCRGLLRAQASGLESGWGEGGLLGHREDLPGSCGLLLEKDNPEWA